MLESVEMRTAYCSALIEQAEKDPRVVVLDSDLGGACGTKPFMTRFPTRYFNVGIAEANMVGIAAGMAACGKLPWVHSFGPFVTRRCFDQVTISVGYARQNVRLIGTDPGISAEANGGTHMPLEDVGIMRTLPNMCIFEPVDAVQLAAAMPAILAHKGPLYMRLLRKKAESVFADFYSENRPFDLYHADTVRPGSDITLIATGLTVAYCLEAATALSGEGILVRVINMHTLPVDEVAVIQAAEETGRIITVENHNVVGGLGSAVAEVLCEHRPTPLYRLGARGRYGEVGTREYLAEQLGIDAAAVTRACREMMAKA